MRDLLNGIGGRGASEDSAEEDSGEIELSLGLSLGGCFGVDPRRKGVLVRSSSIASMPPVGEGEGEREREKLVRTCSLPVEADEEQKRKSMQTMRRMEAKRRRMEKRGGKCEVEGKVGNPASGGFTWRGGAAEEERISRAVSQRSVGSQGSCSVGEAGSLDGGRIQGLRCAVDVGANPSMATSGNDVSKKVDDSGRGQGGSERTMMEQMPCVSTKGEGPDGRVIEGFLYKYNKGEEVKIVCVCHGRFLTPAEFVKHAGGGDVAYPLRHIVVKPSSFAFL